MTQTDWIKLDQFCKLYKVQPSVVKTLHSYDLISITVIDNDEYLTKKEIRNAEQVIGLYHELNINPEGIDVIRNLLKRIRQQEKELMRLRNRLRIYQD